MSATVCPFCEALVNFTPMWEYPVVPPGSGYRDDYDYKIGAQRCNNPQCEMVIVTVSDSDIIEIWPKHVGGKEFPDVPQHIASAADEAHRCFSIGSLRAAVLLARSVVEATAKEKGITRGTLANRIDEMADQNLVREYVKDGAHEVRHLGNDMAHGDFVLPVELSEAELVLALMDEVLGEVFQGPARVANARAARLAKRQTTQGS